MVLYFKLVKFRIKKKDLTLKRENANLSNNQLYKNSFIKPWKSFHYNRDKKIQKKILEINACNNHTRKLVSTICHIYLQAFQFFLFCWYFL